MLGSNLKAGLLSADVTKSSVLISSTLFNSPLANCIRDPLLKLAGNTSGPFPICKPLLLSFDNVTDDAVEVENVRAEDVIDDDNEVGSDDNAEDEEDVTDDETRSGRIEVVVVDVAGDVVVVRILCFKDPSFPDGTLNFLSL